MMKYRIRFSFISLKSAKAVLICLFVTFTIQTVYAQPAIDTVVHRVVQIGNTADILTNTYYQHLQSYFSSFSGPFSLIINGDVVTTELTAASAQGDSVRIRNLLNTFSTFSMAQAIVLPGDRDWSHSEKGGLKNAVMLEKLIRSFELKNVNWAINKGCPGPEVFTLRENLLLIAINTQWWNHPFKKPQAADARCSISTEDDFLEALQDILDENEDKNILIAGHFPIISKGEYGGYIPLKKHLFPLTDFNPKLYIPLPIAGSFYAAYRQQIGTTKDIINDRFNEFRHKLQAIFSSRNNLIYLSGHEHNLQILQENTNYYINSGSPEKATFAPRQNRNDFVKAIPGFIELLYYQSGRVEAAIYKWDKEKGFAHYYSQPLYQSACQPVDATIPINYAFVPCTKEEKAAAAFVSKPKIRLATKTVSAGSEYKAAYLKKLFWGNHYRDAWTTAVEVPILDLDTTYHGLHAYKKGGGRQTKSLKFKADNGKEYVFRSVNKDPSKALRYELRETILGRVLRDQTTTQHPYGAMAADMMLNAIDVLHVHPRLYVLPDDKKLGPFQKEFAHLLGMLEEKPSVPKKAEKGFAKAEKIVKSFELFRELYNNPHAKVDGKEFARARVFDILVGDWGKHEDNWKWALYKQGDEKLYRPIPRDRDHVFSRWDGLIPWLADRKWAKASGENFGYTLKDIRSLTWQSRHLDRFVATELTKNDWLEAAKSIQKSITEEVIEKAIACMPSGKHAYVNEQISRKLKARIKDLDNYALLYYRLLARYVDVVGSNKDEYFEVRRNTDGSVEVILYENKKNSQILEKIPLYQRTFYPSETKEIRLYGLKGKDVFIVSGESNKSIKIRIIGGPGSDTIREQSVVKKGSKKTFIYEQSPLGEIAPGDEGKRVNHPNPQVYNYNRTAFAYPTYFPSPYIGYNQHNGIEFSMGMQFQRQKFGKSDYSLRHQFRASATTQGNFVFNYSSRFHHLIRKWDLELEGTIARPDNYNFFFGLGNQTVKDDKLFENDYYLSRYNRYGLGTSLIREFWKRSSFTFKIAYGRFAGLKEPNTFVGEGGNLFGIAPLHMMESVLTLDIDFRDNPSLPNKGIRLYVSHQNGVITNDNASNYGITSASIEHYSSLKGKFPITLGVIAGGADSYGKIPFYKLPSLGQQNDLRGYVRHRFTGNGKLYVNSELRLQLLDINTSIVPMKMGVKGFYDWGRVYVNGEDSKTWHKGYGAGIYVVPLDERFTCSTSVAFSKEESPFFLISIGRAFR